MSAADKLLGLHLKDGWKVTRHLPRGPNSTGGMFSQSYIAEKGTAVGFLKAFDFSPAMEPDVDMANEIQKLIACYNHERAILDHCRGRRLSKVVVALDHGDVQVPGMGPMEGRVFYLIFEMAEGDVRVQMDTSTACDALWCMHALKDITLGLWQVHKEMIAHQDGKPSNVLAYPGPSFKVADFGRSSRKGQPAAHDDCKIAGDRGYAPPEQLYGFVHPEFTNRRIGCDLYMLGNLAAFLFSGVNITPLLLSKLDPQHHPRAWGGNYEQVLPYVRNAFSAVLADVSPLIDKRVRTDVLGLVREFCDPDLQRRGHPEHLGRPTQFSLERYVSRMDLAAKRLSVLIRAGRAA